MRRTIWRRHSVINQGKFMDNLYRVFLVPLLLSLAACGGASYEEGKSSSDVPAHVNTIKIKDVYMTVLLASTDSNGDYERDTNPSSNDQEVTAVAKANIVDQFTNLGYKVVEGDAPADIDTKFTLYYQPERWPLVDREFHVWARFYNSSDVPLFKVHTNDVNAVGLIGAVVGPSRDDMVSSVSRKAVVEGVDELRKGTLENSPVDQSTGTLTPKKRKAS